MNRFKKQSLSLILAMICLLVSGCTKTNGVVKQTKQDLVVENCVVTTKWYEFSYPQAMIDVIGIEKEEGKFNGNLEFYARLTDSEVKIFDLKYNNESGDWTLLFETTNGKKIPVSFEMYEVPDNLNRDETATVCAAQEVVNDIVATFRIK